MTATRKKSEGNEQVSQADVSRKSVRGGGTASAKALRCVSGMFKEQ